MTDKQLPSDRVRASRRFPRQREGGHPERRFTRAQACYYLNISPQTARRREQQGLLTPIKDIEGGRVYYAWSEIAALLPKRAEP